MDFAQIELVKYNKQAYVYRDERIKGSRIEFTVADPLLHLRKIDRYISLVYKDLTPFRKNDRGIEVAYYMGDSILSNIYPKGYMF